MLYPQKEPRDRGKRACMPSIAPCQGLFCWDSYLSELAGVEALQHARGDGDAHGGAGQQVVNEGLVEGQLGRDPAGVRAVPLPVALVFAPPRHLCTPSAIE